MYVCGFAPYARKRKWGDLNEILGGRLNIEMYILAGAKKVAFSDDLLVTVETKCIRVCGKGILVYK